MIIPKEIRLQQEVFKQKLINKRICKQAAELVEQNLALKAALETLMHRAEQCDSWESFPSEYLDDACKVLDGKR